MSFLSLGANRDTKARHTPSVPHQLAPWSLAVLPGKVRFIRTAEGQEVVKLVSVRDR